MESKITIEVKNNVYKEGSVKQTAPRSKETGKKMIWHNMCQRILHLKHKN